MTYLVQGPFSKKGQVYSSGVKVTPGAKSRALRLKCLRRMCKALVHAGQLV